MPTPEIDPAEVQAAITELMTPRASYDPRAELLAAGNFVADYGSLGDWYSGQDLATLQLWTGSHDAAWHMITHWSIKRHDPDTEPPDSFDDHEAHCTTCKYLETAYGLHMSFEFEYCEECGLDLDKHEIAPDPLGLAHAWCCAVKWTRREPWVHGNNWPGGDEQTEDGWDCSWWTTLSDGTFAVVTRYYYLARKTDGGGEHVGDPFVTEQTEYMVCTDRRQPGDTEITSTEQYVDLDDPATLDTRQLAMDAEEPTSGEWVQYAPADMQQLLVVGEAPGLTGVPA